MGVFLWVFGVFVDAAAAYVCLGRFGVDVCFDVLICVVVVSCMCCVVWVLVVVLFCGGCVVVVFLSYVLCPNRFCSSAPCQSEPFPS